eukprot:CAMPEP_0114311678 /NCGR_PEP_ID=MMETSP0059-20121206/19963_1 /TAXON_ID=36894 /ORGANISM="Pyramimonas parkeae, Strain CCMP726" /LENGTH=247 /DNA_ID=CAMNT_0001435889 /DNA_START=279 /DNA_END=1022 /DNA_ORIENTATION=+
MESIVPRASNEDNVDRTISGLDAMLGIDPEEEKRKERRMQEEEAERTRRREARDAAAKTSLDPPVKPVKPAPPAGTVRGALGSQELDSSSGDGIWRRWDVPWSFTTLVLGVVGVEVAYIAAGLVAPIVVLLAAENDGLIDLQEITSDEPLQSQSQVLRPSDSSGQQSEIVTAPSLSGAPESPASGTPRAGTQIWLNLRQALSLVHASCVFVVPVDDVKPLIPQAIASRCLRMISRVKFFLRVSLLNI